MAKTVLDITETEVREQVIENDEVVDVVPSIKDRREGGNAGASRTCWGMPVQQRHDDLENRVVELETLLAERQTWPAH